ncbi:MAG TPA: DUF72 domain-containing protein [Bacillus sp. (in: firmicutes)]|uniref:DUF72 domain-containing protein n=1 Tax=Bacillus litorisediminis TaxID=2922713 RepID=UPI001FAECFCA|nr:DUF72 domain-containing protein [Bacillus litorisediminis]HWO77158.1 DUF72 domain-containing protein [Bacillus sp. (in: firmicutes)]
MIYIGLAGWGDHDDLYPGHITAKDKLKEYASHFPIVEVDASFYAIQKEATTRKWTQDTPDGFRFIVKAYQGLTGHNRGELPFSSKEDMFKQFKASLQPYVDSNKLAMVLFQFPPWFGCTKENVNYLRWCKEHMGELPAALEFRNQTWFHHSMRDKTLDFMKKEGWIHSICDEPQVGLGSVPTILTPTHPEKTLIRFHGRNISGWLKKQDTNWREVRYLYRYNQEELLQWKEYIKELQQTCQHIYVIFNNNSGGDAADNGKMMMDLMELRYEKLHDRQLDLFHDFLHPKD